MIDKSKFYQQLAARDKIWVLDSRGLNADHKLHEIDDYFGGEAYRGMCGRFAMGRSFRKLPSQYNYCEDCFNMKFDFREPIAKAESN